jgi:hypothetical protein
MATKRKKVTRKRKLPGITAADLKRNTWTVQQAANWAGLSNRTLYPMLRAGLVPSIQIGDEQTQSLPNARTGERKRKCYRFVIPRVAFMKAWESFNVHGKPDSVSGIVSAA